MTKTIMLVDDEPDTLLIVGKQLKNEGYEVLTAGSGPEALRQIEVRLPDLVILDSQMPGMSGPQVCQILRSKPESADLPIIMLSAHAQVEDKVAGLRAGADDYIIKPTQKDELIARIEALLIRSRRQRKEPVKPGRVAAFMGVKGGVGTSTISLNIAATLAQQQKSVILIELRPTYGTLSVLLKASPKGNLMNLIDLRADQIDERNLSEQLYTSESGLKVLFGPQRPAEFHELDPDWAAAIVRQASTMADYVVIDLPPLPTSASRAAIALAHAVALVLEPERASVTAAQVILEMLVSWGIDRELVAAVIANRAGITIATPLRDIKKQLGCEILGVVTPATEACLLAQERGMPLVLCMPETMAATTLTEMATRFAAGRRASIEY